MPARPGAPPKRRRPPCGTPSTGSNASAPLALEDQQENVAYVREHSRAVTAPFPTLLMSDYVAPSAEREPRPPLLRRVSSSSTIRRPRQAEPPPEWHPVATAGIGTRALLSVLARGPTRKTLRRRAAPMRVQSGASGRWRSSSSADDLTDHPRLRLCGQGQLDVTVDRWNTGCPNAAVPRAVRNRAPTP